MPRLRYTILEGVLWAAIACVAFGLSFQFDEPLMQYRYGASGWPRALIVAIALFAVIQALWSILLSRGEGVGGQSTAQSSDGSAADSSTGVMVGLKRFGTFGLPLLYLLLLPRAGFYIVTPLLIAGYMALLGERRLIHLVGTTLLIYAISLIVFTELLYVPLPVGTWPGFYDINSFFVALIK